MRQEQFLEVVSREEALERWRAALPRDPVVSRDEIPLDAALGRVCARDVTAPGDVPAFDRSDVDGWAVRASDTWGASEEEPVRLRRNAEEIHPGIQPAEAVAAGTASSIATGGALPRGADAVVMVEHTELDGEQILVRRPVVPGERVTFAGTDVARGETVLRRGEILTARETGVLAACGIDHVVALARLRVAVLSTGGEIVPPGRPLPPAGVHDANSRAVADAMRESGLEPVVFEPVVDDEVLLEEALEEALARADAVVLSGGTSKGAGDLNYRVLARREPGVLVHGVALKPGKPLCLGAVGSHPVAILPGFPTSALFTFHDVVLPVLRSLAGLPAVSASGEIEARLAQRIPSELGRREYALVMLADGGEGGGRAAWPMGKGSGSITTWARADGWIVADALRESLEEGATVRVRLLGRELRPADLVVIGSHCTGLDILLGRLAERGFTAKVLAAGSLAGAEAARRGECDLAPVHLLDPATGEYNLHLAGEGVELLAGYGRTQGIVFRRDDPRFAGAASAAEVRDVLIADPGPRLVNRQRGSGTRALMEELLGDARPEGWEAEVRSHNAVAAAVAQRRADWGLAIGGVAEAYDLGFLPLAEERYDFLVPRSRADRPAVRSFRELLADEETRRRLREAGFRPMDLDGGEG